MTPPDPGAIKEQRSPTAYRLPDDPADILPVWPPRPHIPSGEAISDALRAAHSDAHDTIPTPADTAGTIPEVLR